METIQIVLRHLHHSPSQGGLTATTAVDFNGSVLDFVPHQLHGFFVQFRAVVLAVAAFDRCMQAMKAYETGFLEALTRLDKLHAESEPALEAAD